MALPDEDNSNDKNPKEPLVSWILDKVELWRQYRDDNFKDKWDEYYRLWRGVWSPEDKTRQSERSRLIAPALQQAVETMVSELEEATFGRANWIDVSDDMDDQERQDIEQYRKRMLEEMKLHGVLKGISETFLNASLYGTGIAKVVVEEIETKQPINTQQLGINIPTVVTNKERVIKLYPVEPSQFIIDPIARNIEDAMGCAHETLVPIYSIVKKQIDGVYSDEVIVGPWADDGRIEASWRRGENKDNDTQNKVKIIEYHGLVPKKLLSKETDSSDYVSFSELAGEEKEESEETSVVLEAEMVEAIVVIANDYVLLKAEPNPYIMKDRCFIAYQHDTVPNRFWGRGVAEKGYNAQKALDAELRARIDALAFSTNPMMGINATTMPRGFNFKVSPGRSILTNGPPSESLLPINFNPPDPQTYRHAADMERMVSNATGAMDAAAPLVVNARNETASGMSMMMSAAIKRSKRTLSNIERFFLTPLVNKFLWRSIQFKPETYPSKDYKFVVNATMGIMAREYEQQQIVQLMNTTEPGSPAYFMLLRSFYNNSNSEDKESLVALTEQMLQNSMQPQQTEPPPPPTLGEQAQMAKVELDKAKAAADIKLQEKELELKEKELALKAKELELKEKELVADTAIRKEEVEVKKKQASAKKYDPKTKKLSD